MLKFLVVNYGWILCTYYKNKTFYLVGGKQQSHRDTVEKLKKEFKGLIFLIFEMAISKQSRRKRLIQDIKTLKPDVIFVAMGLPNKNY